MKRLLNLTMLLVASLALTSFALAEESEDQLAQIVRNATQRYEPQSNGELKLVGVEFIILASALPPGVLPQVQGHLMLYGRIAR